MNNRIKIILAVVAVILMIPLIAMQFSTEVNWTAFDFLVAGVLLLGTGLALELVLRKVSDRRSRLLLSMAVLAALVLVWLELAVGIFGSPLAGS